MYVAGGLNHKTQVSIVSDCGLEQSDIFLPMPFDNGQCSTLQSNTVFMCFAYDEKNACWTFDGNNFVRQMDSENSHYLGGLAEWNSTVMAVAGIEGVTTEFLESNWEELGI